MVKTVPNSAKTVPNQIPAYSPFQQRADLHQKDLRIIPVFLHILGPGNEAVSWGGHYSGLKSNRQVYRRQGPINLTTCRHSSQTAV